MRLSARNILKGRIKQVTHGAVESEVLIELAPGVELVSTITKASAEALKLASGMEACAIIKASNIIVGVE